MKSLEKDNSRKKTSEKDNSGNEKLKKDNSEQEQSEQMTILKRNNLKMDSFEKDKPEK